MWLLKIILWGCAILLFFVGVFGGVLDVASLTGINISQWAAVAIAAGFLVIEREVKVLTLGGKLNARRDPQRRIDKLAEFRSDVISTPVKIITITKTQGAMDTQIVGDLLYLACHGNGVRILDIADPLFPKTIASFNNGGEAYGAGGDLNDLWIGDL